MAHMIWIYLVDAYPTETDCRTSVTTMDRDAHYLGRWHAPTEGRPEVHVFSVEVDRDELLRKGWVPA